MKTGVTYKDIFESVRNGIAVVDNASGFLVDVNKSFCSIMGRERDFLLSGVNLNSVVGPELIFTDYEKALQLLTKDKEAFVRSCKYLKPDGSCGCLKITMSALDVETGDYTLIVAEDITTAEDSKDTLQESEEHFRYLFESSPVGLWEEDFSDVVPYLESIQLLGKSADVVLNVLNSNPGHVLKCLELLKIVDVNKAVLEQYKVTDKAAFLKNAHQLIATPKGIEVAKNFLVSICQDAESDVEETEGFAIDGEKIFMQLSWHVAPSADPEKYKRVILASSDITAIKKTQMALEATTARFESIVNTIDGIVWTADPKTFVLSFVSDKVEELTGYSREQYIGKTLFSSIPDFYIDPPSIDRLKEKINGEHPVIVEYPVKTRFGNVRWFQNNISCIKDKYQVQLLLGIAVDISVIKEAKQALGESLEAVSNQNRRLMNFSYIVSHNLRSHSSNILSLCELLLHAKTDEEKDEFIGLINNVTRLLHNTLEGLNAVTKIQPANAIEIADISLKQVVEEAVHILRDQIIDKKATIKNLVDETVVIRYNRTYLESIILNFLSNAVRYASPDRLPEVSVLFYNEGDEDVLVFKDNGIGIDLNLNEGKVFELFKTFSHNPGSRGIGLYIAKNQIETMGGRIGIESEPGKGSSFKIYFKK